MLRPNRMPVIALAIVFFALAVFAPSYGWRIRSFFSPPDAVSEQNQDLASQNEALQAQLAQYEDIASEMPNVPANSIRAMVYSRSPANFRDEFLINAGSQDGIVVGHAVMIAGASSSYILIGKIQQAWNSIALVQSVFDSSFRMPVRVGPQGYDGLFVGGSYPKISSLLKSAAISPGDVVYAADSSLPYGIAVAQVSGVSVSADNLFQEAQLSFPYDMNAVQTVAVQR